jgi:hypothetical protein
MARTEPELTDANGSSGRGIATPTGATLGPQATDTHGQPRSPADSETRSAPRRPQIARPAKLTYDDEVTPELPRRVRGLPTSRWSPETGLTLRAA